MPSRTLSLCLLLIGGVFSAGTFLYAAQAHNKVAIVTDADPGPAAQHGLAKVLDALAKRGLDGRLVDKVEPAADSTLLVAGLASNDGQAARLLGSLDANVADDPESLLIQHTEIDGRPGLLVAGSDDRGLMYGLLDVADRIGWAADPARPFAEVENAAESPFVSDRAVSIYTMHQACFEQRFYDEAYWARYFDMLAADRFNRFVLIFGYENWGYFSPPYPYFFDVDGYRQVRVVGITPDIQRKNLRALTRMIDMAHQRGLEFTVAIWDHIYRGGVQGPKDRAEKPTEGIVWGLNQDNLVPYTKLALAEFLKQVPHIDSIQFRMHGESGLRHDEMEDFWTDVYRIMKAHRPGMRFDARAKNFPDSLIDRALEIGVPIRICTKHWMEQMGMPFHPTHIHPNNQHDRRHGYADLLRYPRRYDMHWRLWNAGTTRVLLWGDPDYVRRFAECTHLYDGKGFEINEMMGTKMQDHPHDLPPFDLMPDAHRYYDWEFERYWYFFQTFGRVSYNPAASDAVLRRGFMDRFGPQAGATVQQALHQASKILPRAVAYCYPYGHFPTTRGWVARQRQGDLPDYARSLPSDTEQFLSMDEAARCVLEGEDSAKIWPEESADWFARASREVLRLAEQAEGEIGARRNKEFASTMVDLRILAHLAEYHSHRARAGFQWALFDRCKDVRALDRAIAAETEAVAAWSRIVVAAGDFYHDDLMMGRRGSDLSGHWRDELAKLQAGLEKLHDQRRNFQPQGQAGHVEIAQVATDDSAPPQVEHTPIVRAPAAQPLTVKATVTDPSGVKWVRLRYRSVSQYFDYKTLVMERTGGNEYTATVPASDIAPEWDFMYFIETVDGVGNGAIYPDLEITAPYVIVRLDR